MSPSDNLIAEARQEQATCARLLFKAAHEYLPSERARLISAAYTHAGAADKLEDLGARAQAAESQVQRGPRL